jgi:CBS domain-containing protein
VFSASDIGTAPDAPERRAREYGADRTTEGGEMLVSQLMTRDVVTVRPETPLKEVARILETRAISGVPVLDGDEVVGVVSSGDVLYKERGPLAHREHAQQDGSKLAARTAGDAMTTPPVTVTPSCSVSSAARLLADRGLHRLPVLENGRLVGIITRGDLVRAFTRSDAELEREIRRVHVLHSLWQPRRDGVTAVVDDGAVSLSGHVLDETVAQLLPQLVARIPGVVSVDARLSRESQRTTADVV